MQQIPDVLRRFYERNVTHPAPEPCGSVIEQRGELRLAEDGKWLPFTAEQWFSARETAFSWRARVKMAPLVSAVVEDAFEHGEGRLDAKVWRIITVAHGRGREVDRGEIQRYLAELPWNPMAILHNPELSFGEGEDGPIRVWCGHPDTYVDLRFDEAGDIAGTFSRTRCRKEGEPLPWEGRFWDYVDFGVSRIPSHAEVFWHTASGVFAYWRCSITRFEWREPPARRHVG